VRIHARNVRRWPGLVRLGAAGQELFGEPAAAGAGAGRGRRGGRHGHSLASAVVYRSVKLLSQARKCGSPALMMHPEAGSPASGQQPGTRGVPIGQYPVPRRR
jgi:hypothetical protein